MVNKKVRTNKKKNNLFTIIIFKFLTLLYFSLSLSLSLSLFSFLFLSHLRRIRQTVAHCRAPTPQRAHRSRSTATEYRESRCDTESCSPRAAAKSSAFSRNVSSRARERNHFFFSFFLPVQKSTVADSLRESLEFRLTRRHCSSPTSRTGD